jgi:hypothetical protein
MKTVEVLLAIINGLINSLSEIISRTINFLLNKVIGCFDLENNGLKYLGFMATVCIFFFGFCIYKTCITPNVTTHCEIIYSPEMTSFKLVGVKQWMHENNNLGYFKSFDEALEKAKQINCSVGR